MPLPTLLSKLIPTAILCALVYVPGAAAQTGIQPSTSRTILAATPLAAAIDNHIPLKLGQPVRAELLYPVYSGSTELLPQRTVLEGSIVALTPDRKLRHHAMIRGDFTPFRTPTVRFTSVKLADGTSAPIALGEATGGAPFLSITPPPPATGGIVHRAFDRFKQTVHTQIQVFTAPGLGDRLLQTLYFALPYHPQRLEKSTAWSFETTQPFTLAASQTPRVEPEPAATPQKALAPPTSAVVKQDGPPTWILQAFLNEDLSSATTPVGQPIHATVAAPIFNPDRTVAVPVGSVLTGTVVSVKPARSWGRTGTLRFAFNKLTLPDSQPTSVQATLTGIDAQSKIALDSEGQSKSQTPSIAVPLLLALLANHALDQDPGAGAARTAGQNGAGANGFGLVGVVVGLAAQSAYVAAGIGYYGAALTVYDRFLTHGKQVTFARNTRLNVQTTGRRSSAIKPTSTQTQPARRAAAPPGS